MRNGLWLAAFILSYLVVAIVAGLHWGVEACLGVMLIGALVEAGIGIATWIKSARQESGRAK